MRSKCIILGGIGVLSKRQQEILLYLIKSNEVVTAKWIAKEIGVSDRTIREEMNVIKDNCFVLGVSIESIRGKGYKICIENQQLFKSKINDFIEKEKSEGTTNFSYQKNRVEYLVKHLLLEKQGIKIEKFVDELFVSKSTIQNDLKKVKEILNKYKLKLENRPYYGTYVEGNEYMKRICLANYIFKDNNALNIDKKTVQLFEKVKSIIIKKVNKYKLEISDISLHNLTTHIMIACRRIEEKSIIENIKDNLIKKYPLEKNVACEIVQEVEEFTGLVFPSPEIDYIILHLLGTKLLYKKVIFESKEFDDAKNVIDCMIERLKTEFNLELIDDKEFIQELTLHIRSAINRLKYEMNIRNPLLNEIKVKYPISFDGAVIASKCIEDYLSLKVGEHEIAYIALHIATALERKKMKQNKVKRAIIVCASGVGSAKLLFYHLKKLFRDELEIVGTINCYELNHHDFSSIDFIISTIPIREDIGIPVQVVNTFLEEEDINNIKNRLYFMPKIKTSLFLHPSRVFIHKDFKDKESVLKFMCGELYKQKLVSENYIDLVLERELLAPTCFGNLVAIPHPMKSVTKETFWTICTLKHPILWNDNHMVQFICLLNIQEQIQENTREILSDMYEKLTCVVEDKGIVQKIIDSNSVDEIINILV